MEQEQLSVPSATYPKEGWEQRWSSTQGVQVGPRRSIILAAYFMCYPARAFSITFVISLFKMHLKERNYKLYLTGCQK